MTFGSDEARDTFHQLPTQKQYELTHFEDQLARKGYSLHIDNVEFDRTAGELKVIIHIYGKLNY